MPTKKKRGRPRTIRSVNSEIQEAGDALQQAKEELSKPTELKLAQEAVEDLGDLLSEAEKEKQALIETLEGKKKKRGRPKGSTNKTPKLVERIVRTKGKKKAQPEKVVVSTEEILTRKLALAEMAVSLGGWEKVWEAALVLGLPPVSVRDLRAFVGK